MDAKASMAPSVDLTLPFIQPQPAVCPHTLPSGYFFFLPQLIDSASGTTVENPVWSPCRWSPLASLPLFTRCSLCSFTSRPTAAAAVFQAKAKLHHFVLLLLSDHVSKVSCCTSHNDFGLSLFFVIQNSTSTLNRLRFFT